MDDGVRDELFEITLTGEGLSLSRKIRPEVARSIVNLVMGGGTQETATQLEKPVPPAPSGAGSTAPRDQARPSLREYLDDCAAVRYPDKITAIGNYIIELEGSSDFGRDEVKGKFRTAGEAAPGNYPRDFNWALRAGWVAEDPNASGRFYVTQKGRGAILSKFSAEVRKATSLGKGRKQRRKAGFDAGEAGAE